MNATEAPYRFLAFDVSYFSSKVRPALRYKQLWFTELPANIPEIQRRTGLHYIPILITPEGETWQDSSDIVDRLEARHPDPPLIPHTPAQNIVAHLVELYVDEFGLIPAMHYRWGSELGEASSRARFSAMIGDTKLGNMAADRMLTAKELVGASAAAAPQIEAHTRALLDALCAHFEAHPFLLGGRMSLADTALMGPLYAHLFVDLVSRRLLLETAPPVVGWIERCSSPDADTQTDWLPADAIAPTLREVLTVMGRDAAPLIGSIVASIEAFADERSTHDDSVAPFVGACEVTFRGATVKRGATLHTLWMLQRTLDLYDALGAEERERVDAMVDGTGWEAVLAYVPRHRLAKRGFELIFN